MDFILDKPESSKLTSGVLLFQSVTSNGLVPVVALGKSSMAQDVDVDQYVALVPRGFEHVVAEMVQRKLSLFQFRVTVTLLGETEDMLSSIHGCTFPKHHNCAFSVGTVELPSHQHLSVGYASSTDSSSNVWTVTGQMEGTVWMEISTDAPVNVVAELRCIGPLLALVTCYNDLSVGQELEETSRRIQQRIATDRSYGTKFEAALRLWRRHVLDLWSDTPLGHCADADIRYRVSCLRNDSKRYPYTRRELLGMVGDCVVPSCHSHWSVHLTNYNLETVLFQRPNSLLIGFALRPYQMLQTRSFASGELPPDVAAPCLHSSLQMVRLRSTTAQVLLHLAQLQVGDVVLDPCVGVGTIPLEAARLFRHCCVVSLGGDLAMDDPEFQAMTVEYRTACAPLSRSPVSDFMAWDATHLPIRSESIDAIVTDLPFGQLCLSAKKLDALLPLLLAEMARVVRRGTGRLVLLCGSYAPIVKALQYANERLILNRNTLIWEVPFSAVFPVNIGGNLAWIIQVRRGSGALAPVTGQLERIRKLVRKREHTEKMMQGSLANKKKHLQS